MSLMVFERDVRDCNEKSSMEIKLGDSVIEMPRFELVSFQLLSYNKIRAHEYMNQVRLQRKIA